uniref:Ubiquitin-like modifier-activating enzyme ATG7 n=1 Tax=Timema douglasi TaxID=61478 RepID=A0A7R8VDU5_TIMDO|nr:unnamed protein product [Timema douglasi]
MAQTTNTNEILQFASFTSYVEPSFWHKLSQLKLDIDKLEEKVRPIWGKYSSYTSNTSLKPSVFVDYSAYNDQFEEGNMQLPIKGQLLNLNTLEDFKSCDKTKLLNDYGQTVWKHITSGKVFENPTLLVSFLLLTHADLKKYHFYYWFAFLAVKSVPTTYINKPQNISEVFSQHQLSLLDKAVQDVEDWNLYSAFLLDVDSENVRLRLLREIKTKLGHYVGFCDPSMSPEYPGWPLRNLLALLAYHFPELIGTEVNIICLRLSLSKGIRTANASVVLSVKLPPLTELSGSGEDTVKWIGWERNDRGNFGPRLADLASSMNPLKLVETSVDLNLKLMKWRLVPDLDLECLKQLRCLLLGAGTLGCSVARLLLAWGVGKITLVDNGRVSYSNPVRQSLFTYKDSLYKGQGSHKAEAAADALKLINPHINANGVNLSIPMPGHVIGELLQNGDENPQALEARKSFEQLQQLIETHDTVFLLMDSRESRWLPTLLSAFSKKLVINAALGFDTYLVMRHGLQGEEPNEGPELGCYFCNDVTAPGDSQRDRTLDQKCTVTRPGVSGIASGLAVELMVATLQHPLGGKAPAISEDERSPLGTVPHSIRGFLSQWQQISVTSHKFDRCIACSETVLKEFEVRNFEFLLDVFNTPNYLEDLTGLTALKQETNSDEVWELSDSDMSDKDEGI